VHLAGVWDYDPAGDNYTWRLYRNGIVIAELVKPQGAVTGSGDWLAGASTDHTLKVTRFFKGSLAELRVWAVARSEHEIRAAMFRRLNGKEPGLQGYWPIDEGNGRFALDQGPQKIAASIRGASWQAGERPGSGDEPLGRSAQATYLGFAQISGPPTLHEGSDGLLHLYCKDSAGQLAVAQFSSLVQRACFAIPVGPGEVRFIAHQPDGRMNQA
jgi:hypothetical protein